MKNFVSGPIEVLLKSSFCNLWSTFEVHFWIAIINWNWWFSSLAVEFCFAPYIHYCNTDAEYFYKDIINNKNLINISHKYVNLDDADSMYLYGILLYNGDGIEVNKKEAAKYFKASSEKGNINSMYYYAKILFEQNETISKIEEAVYYIKTSADKGNVDSMLQYGIMLLNGNGVQINKQDAEKYLKNAADLGKLCFNMEKWF